MDGLVSVILNVISIIPYVSAIVVEYTAVTRLSLMLALLANVLLLLLLAMFLQLVEMLLLLLFTDYLKPVQHPGIDRNVPKLLECLRESALLVICQGRIEVDGSCYEE